MAVLTGDEVRQLIVDNLPAVDQHGETVAVTGENEIEVRVPFRQDYLGTDPWGDGGQVFSGPMMMGLADTAMYGCAHAVYGRDVVAVIVSLTVTFLVPARPADLIARARVMRRGRSLAYLDAELFSDGHPTRIAHVTATYRVRNRDTGR